MLWAQTAADYKGTWKKRVGSLPPKLQNSDCPEMLREPACWSALTPIGSMARVAACCNCRFQQMGRCKIPGLPSLTPPSLSSPPCSQVMQRQSKRALALCVKGGIGGATRAHEAAEAPSPPAASEPTTSWATQRPQ